jgi:hypothetical protein
MLRGMRGAVLLGDSCCVPAICVGSETRRRGERERRGSGERNERDRNPSRGGSTGLELCLRRDRELVRWIVKRFGVPLPTLPPPPGIWWV